MTDTDTVRTAMAIDEYKQKIKVCHTIPMLYHTYAIPYLGIAAVDTTSCGLCLALALALCVL